MENVVLSVQFSNPEFSDLVSSAFCFPAELKCWCPAYPDLWPTVFFWDSANPSLALTKTDTAGLGLSGLPPPPVCEPFPLPQGILGGPPPFFPFGWERDYSLNSARHLPARCGDSPCCPTPLSLFPHPTELRQREPPTE